MGSNTTAAVKAHSYGVCLIRAFAADSWVSAEIGHFLVVRTTTFHCRFIRQMHIM